MTAATAPRFVPAVEQLGDRIVPAALTTRASLTATGAEIPGFASFVEDVSANGRFVAFSTTAKAAPTDTNALPDIYLFDRSTNTTALVSVTAGGVAVGNAHQASVSGDGRYVAYVTDQVGIATGFGGGLKFNVYVRDMMTGQTVVGSADAAGTESDASSSHPSLSSDGRTLAFQSGSADIVPLFGGGVTNVFVRDLTTGQVVVASKNFLGLQAGADSSVPVLSGNGRFVTFESTAADLVPGFGLFNSQVFVRDLTTGAITVASKNAAGIQPDAGAFGADVSDDGRYVSFLSNATDLVSGFGGRPVGLDWDVFVRDMIAGTTVVASQDSTGLPSETGSSSAKLSGDGRSVAFVSAAGDIVPGFGAGKRGIFVRNLSAGTTRVADANLKGGRADGEQVGPVISRDGSVVAFQSTSTDLAVGDTNAVQDVFVTRSLRPSVYAVGTGAGGGSRVEVYTSDVKGSRFFDAYPGFTGGTFVSLGDMTGDGIDDIITSTGPGGTAHIKVFDGSLGEDDPKALLASFFGYPEAFTGGVNVDVGDVNGDGVADIVCGVGVGGGPNIRIFDGVQIRKGNYILEPVEAGGALIHSFFAYPEAFTGGIRVAVADVNGDGYADVICAVGSGGGPNIRVFDGAQMTARNIKLDVLANGGALIASFYGLPESFTGGMFVSAGDFDSNGLADILVGVENGGGPNVRLYNGTTGAFLDSKYAFDQSLTGGVRVASTDYNQDGYDDLVVGTGPGTQNQVKIISGKDRTTVLQNAFSPFGGVGGFDGGVNVG